MSDKILVLGGAGYIGSVAVKMLCEKGFDVTVVDNLSKGVLDLVDKRAKFVKGDILDFEFLRGVFSLGEFSSVMHFAALKDVGESMKNPSLYAGNNMVGILNVLRSMDEFNVKKIIFSSTAVVYGGVTDKPLHEGLETNPMNFYGFSKLEAERTMEWFRKLKGIDYIALRYFNVAGDGGLGYIDPNAKNIFPILAEIISGKREKLTVFGNDYSTRDGTCIRDYIHVLDLVEAHIMALDLSGSHIMNLGTSNGYTVLDLVSAFKRVSGKDLPYEIVARREGDPACLLASSSKAFELMGWKAKLGLDEMVRSTLDSYGNGE